MLEKAIQKGAPSATPPPDEQGVANASGASLGSACPLPRGAARLTGWVSRVLVACSIVLVLLCGYETYSSMPDAQPELRTRRFDAGITTAVTNQIPLEETMDRFARRRVFGSPPPAGTGEEIEPAGPRGWRAYVRKHMVLKGVSEVDDRGANVLEAIVLDNQSERLQFLRQGAQIQIEAQTVRVVRVGDNQLELRHDDEVMVLD